MDVVQCGTHTSDDGSVPLDDKVLEEDLDNGGWSEFDKREGNPATVPLGSSGLDIHDVRRVIKQVSDVQDVDRCRVINVVGVAFFHELGKVGIRSRKNTVVHEAGILNLRTHNSVV